MIPRLVVGPQPKLRPRRSVAIPLGLAVAAGLGGGIWAAARSGSAAPPAPVQIYKIARGSVASTVNASGQISAVGLAAAGATPPSATASASVAGLPVYPATTGQVARLLVSPGSAVRAGQPLLVLADPAARSALEQASVDLSTAQLAAAGVAPTPQQLAAAKLAVDVARAKLAALSAPPTRDVRTAAALEVTKAQAALDALLAKPVPPTRATLLAAEEAVTVAREKQAALATPASAQAMAAAQLQLQQAQAGLGQADAQFQADQTKYNLDVGNLNGVAGETPGAKDSLQKAQAAVTNDSLQIQKITEFQITYKCTTTCPSPWDPLTLSQLQYRLSADQQVVADWNAIVADQTAITKDQQLSTSATARQAITVAQQNLAALTAPPTAQTKAAAELEVNKAQSALDALLAKPLPPSRATLAAAVRALELANQKRAQLAAAPARAAVAQASLDLGNARLALATLQAGGAPTDARSRALGQLRVQLAQEKAALARQHIAQLVVRAPAAGTVTTVAAQIGATVDPTSVVATIADLGHLLSTVNLSEFDVAHVKVGDGAIVSVPALGGATLKGNVIAIAPVGVSNGGVVQFPVTVAITSKSPGVRPGMLASVTIVTAERHGVVRVPLDAVRVNQGQNAGQTEVTVLGPRGKQTVRSVDLGVIGAAYAEVLNGTLKTGERVLPNPVNVATQSNGASSPSNAPPGIGVPAPAGGDQGGGGGGGG